MLDPSKKARDEPGAGNYVPVYDEDGAAVIDVLIEGVVRNIYFSPEKEEELWEQQRSNQERQRRTYEALTAQGSQDDAAET